MDRAHAWFTVCLTCIAVFFATWMVCEFGLRLDESKSIALASVASAVASLPLASWAQGRSRNSLGSRLSAGKSPWLLFAAANALNVIVLVSFAVVWSLSGMTVTPAPDAGPGNGQSQDVGARKTSPLTDVLTPQPRRQTIALAGQQTAAMVYSLSSKGCLDSGLTLNIALNGKVSTVNATFSLDDRTASTVRTGLTSTMDGVTTDEGVLSVHSGKSLDLDVRGKNSLSFTLTTLGRVEGPCSDEDYILALDGQVSE